MSNRQYQEYLELMKAFFQLLDDLIKEYPNIFGFNETTGQRIIELKKHDIDSNDFAKELYKQKMKLAKLVKVDNWFSRSINLERDSFSIDAINAYVPTSTSIKTLKSLLATFNNKKIARSWSLIGPYGSGKSSFGIFLNALLQPASSEQFKLAIEKIDELDSELAKAFHKKLHKSEGCVNILLTGSYDGLTKKLFDSICLSTADSSLEKKV